MEVFYAPKPMTPLPPHRSRFWWRTVVGPMAAGVVYLWGFDPVGITPMVLLGLTAFLFFLRGLSPVEARREGFLFGMVVTCIGCVWLKNIFGWVFVVLCASQSLFWGLFGWGHAIIDRQPWNQWRKALAVACVWTGVEFIRAEHFWLDFPWLTPGHGLGVIQGITQPLLSWIGVYGVGFVVVTLCFLWYPPVVKFMRGKMTVGWFASRLFQGFIFLCVMGAPLGMIVPSCSRMSFDATALRNRGMPTVAFAAVQDEHGSIDNFISLTNTVTDKADLILWPEEAVPHDLAQFPYEQSLLRDLVKHRNCVLVLGTRQKGAGKAWWNTGLTLDSTGELGRHYKVHPVHLFDDGTPGTTAIPVTTRLGKIGTPICFDCDYEGVVRQMTRNGAEFFAVPSMDPISWGPVQRQMHSELFRIRAAENGRAMVVCATSGVTQVIDGWGGNTWRRPDPNQRPKINMLPIMEPGVLAGVIPVRSGFTFYTLYGWLFPWLALGAGIVIIGGVLVREHGFRKARHAVV